MKRHWEYLKYVLRHKWFVFQEGRKLHLPFLMLILHDWDKFLPDEWFPYARCFYTPDGQKQYDEQGSGMAKAWMKHQHRNKHHWQYWLNAGTTPLSQTNILVWDRGTGSIVIGDHVHSWDGMMFIREPMPDLYRREMLADWRGAGLALGFPNTWEWYAKNKDNIKIHPETRVWIEAELASQQHFYEVDKYRPGAA